MPHFGGLRSAHLSSSGRGIPAARDAAAHPLRYMQQGIVPQPARVALTEPRHPDDAQRENFTRCFGLAIRREEGSAIVNRFPCLVEGGSQNADLVSIEDALIDMFCKAVEHPAGPLFFDRNILSQLIKKQRLVLP